jgi:hypothetical protein
VDASVLPTLAVFSPVPHEKEGFVLAAGSQQLAILTSDREVGYYHGIKLVHVANPLLAVQGVSRLAVYPLAALPLAGAVKTRAS